MLKMNSPRRKIVSDAIDLIPYESEAHFTDKNVVEIPIALIKPYHNHHFHLYEGKRLDDMVESVKKSGIINPVIVLKLDDGTYEMLAGHNRMQAAQLAHLKHIPAIIKTDLTDDECWTIVVETNFYQRSFSEMKPCEQAAVLGLHYDKMQNQGKRNDILKELQILEGLDPTKIPKRGKKSRHELADQYQLSDSSVARLLRLNRLITPFKAMVDDGKFSVQIACQISFLSEQEQNWLLNYINTYCTPVILATAVELHKKSEQGELTEEMVKEICRGRKINKGKSRKIAIRQTTYQSYFVGKKDAEIQDILEKALQLYQQSIGNSN